jgi:GH18 family chitinase
MAWNAAGMPLSKIVVGVPFYGHNMTSIESMANNTGTEEFNLVVGGNNDNNCAGGGFSTSIDWTLIVTYLYPNLTTAIEPWIRKFDTISRSPWLTNSVTNMYIS